MAPTPDPAPSSFEAEIEAIDARVAQSRKLDRWAGRAGWAGMVLLLSPILLLVAFALAWMMLCGFGMACF